MQQNLLINLMNSLGLGVNSYITSHFYYVQKLSELFKSDFNITTDTPEYLEFTNNEVIFKLTIKQNVIRQISLGEIA